MTNAPAAMRSGRIDGDIDTLAVPAAAGSSCVLSHAQAAATYSAMCALNNIGGTLCARLDGGRIEIEETQAGSILIHTEGSDRAREVYESQADFAVAYRVDESAGLLAEALAEPAGPTSTGLVDDGEGRAPGLTMRQAMTAADDVGLFHITREDALRALSDLVTVIKRAQPNPPPILNGAVVKAQAVLKTAEDREAAVVNAAAANTAATEKQVMRAADGAGAHPLTRDEALAALAALVTATRCAGAGLSPKLAGALNKALSLLQAVEARNASIAGAIGVHA